MAITVPSRFAVLSIDDDDFKPTKIKKALSSTSTTNGKSSEKKKVPEKPKQQPKKDEKKKQNKKKKKSSNNNEEQQWEQWKQKDSMAVEESYEQDLHHAILLSKLSYEAQLENSAKLQKDQEQNKKLNPKKSKKSTMSLEEFNNMDANNINQNSNAKVTNNSDNNRLKETNAEFFERVDKEVNQEIRKGKEKETLKARLNQLDDNITSAQLKVEVEKRDEIIKQLKAENDILKKEIGEVKNRNKKLYSILAQGEMKDKAVVLAEVTKLQEIRDELTSTLDTLRIELEQERSKTRASNVDSKSTKQSNKKRPASENA